MTTIAAQLKEITKNAKALRAQLKAFATRFPRIFEFADEIASRPGVYSASAGFHWGGTFRVNFVNLDGFRGQDFLDVLVEIENFFSIEFKMEDKPAYNAKYFTAGIEHNYGSLDIVVEAQLKSDAAECYRVVVGETVETVRIPQYKLVCPEIKE